MPTRSLTIFESISQLQPDFISCCLHVVRLYDKRHAISNAWQRSRTTPNVSLPTKCPQWTCELRGYDELKSPDFGWISPKSWLGNKISSAVPGDDS